MESVDVSPARSAKSDTEVCVTHNLGELVSQITLVMHTEVKGEVERACIYGEKVVAEI